jgi:hypothetical protein
MGVVARCPACAELGSDKSGEHLFIAEAGRGPFGCIAFAGPAGEEHRKRIWELAGGKPGAETWPRPEVSTARPVERPAARFPALRPLTVGEMAAVATRRG